MSTLQWLGEDYQPIIKLTSPPPRKGVKRRSTADTTTTTTGFFSYKQSPPRVVGVCSNCLILVTSHVSLPPTWTSVPAVLSVLTATFLAPRSTSYHGSETWRLALRALCRRQCYEEHKTSLCSSSRHVSDTLPRGAFIVIVSDTLLRGALVAWLRRSPQRSTGRPVSDTVLRGA